MFAAFRIDQLHVHPKPVAATLHRALEHVPDVQFAANLPYVDWFSLIRERAIPRDYEGATDARQVRGQALGHAIDEVILLWITAEIGEREHYNGKMRGRM